VDVTIRSKNKAIPFTSSYLPDIRITLIIVFITLDKVF